MYFFNVFYAKLNKDQDQKSGRSLKSEESTLQPSLYSYEEVDNYEQAINVVGFGKFNVMVLLMLIPMEFAMQFQMYGMSLAVLQVECDYNIGSIYKGVLVMMNIVGMIPTGIIWTLCSDIYGRRKILIIGMVLHTLIRILEVFAINYYMLLITELLGGMVMCGPYAVFLGAVFDFHSSKYRKRVLIVYIAIICITNNVLGLLAFLIMTENYQMFGLLYEWNLFLIIAIIPSLLGLIAVCILPESPKYLLRASQDADALKVLKYIGQLNKAAQRLSSEKPYGELRKPIRAKRMLQKTKMEVKSLKPYVKSLLIAALLQGFLMASDITLRLWIPIMFATQADTVHHEGKQSGVCYMLDFTLLWKREDCNYHHDFRDSFFYSLVVSLLIDVSILIFMLVSRFAKQAYRVMLPVGLIAAASIFCIYFTNAMWQFMLLISIFLMVANALNVAVISVIYEAFPPNMRLSLAYQMALTVGRIFVLITAVIFSFVYNVACIAPFAMLGICVIIAAIISVFIPRKREQYE